MKTILRVIAIIAVLAGVICFGNSYELYTAEIDGGGIGFYSIFLWTDRLSNEEIPVQARKFLISGSILVFVSIAIFLSERYKKRAHS